MKNYFYIIYKMSNQYEVHYIFSDNIIGDFNVYKNKAENFGWKTGIHDINRKLVENGIVPDVFKYSLIYLVSSLDKKLLTVAYVRKRSENEPFEIVFISEIDNIYPNTPENETNYLREQIGRLNGNETFIASNPKDIDFQIYYAFSEPFNSNEQTAIKRKETIDKIAKSIISRGLYWKNEDNTNFVEFCKYNNKNNVNSCLDSNGTIAKKHHKYLFYVYMKKKGTNEIAAYVVIAILPKTGKLVPTITEIHTGKKQIYTTFLANEIIFFTEKLANIDYRGGKRKTAMRNRKRNRRTKKQYSKK